MELFEVVNALFSKTAWESVSRIDKDRYFFMINRFMSINFPRQASMFNLKKIPKDAVLDYWHITMTRLYTRIPSWVYTKGQKAAAKEKDSGFKIEPDLLSFYCSFYQCTKNDVKMMMKFCPDILEADLKEVEAFYKSQLKSAESD